VQWTADSLGENVAVLSKNVFYLFIFFKKISILVKAIADTGISMPITFH